MERAKQGDTVRVHYTGTLDDGQQFDSSRGLDPLTFTLGAGSVIQGFDDAITGMAVGDETRVTIPAAEA
jgi:peptidylprolyl isomerase